MLGWSEWTAVCFTIFSVFLGANPSLSEEPTASDWHYGGSIDLSYAVDFNFPGNHLWRSKTTTPGVNEPALNMAVGYVRKDPSERSRWGLEFGLQEGNDTEGLVPPAIPERDRPIDHATQLKHFSRASVSFLAPIGNGLKVTAGLLLSRPPNSA